MEPKQNNSLYNLQATILYHYNPPSSYPHVDIVSLVCERRHDILLALSVCR